MRTKSSVVPAVCRLLAVASLLVTGTHALQYRQTNKTEFDYIVIGSGPGGGPLASNLARAGFETLLIEAGDDEVADPAANVIQYFASTGIHDNLHWDFYVKHCQYHPPLNAVPRSLFFGVFQEYITLGSVAGD